MAEERLCLECGSEIVFDYVIPIKSYRIDDNGVIVRDDNNDAFGNCGPDLEFYCSEDREHDIGSSDELLDWETIVEQEFKDRSCYDL
jgi:hypothetical protein